MNLFISFFFFFLIFNFYSFKISRAFLNTSFSLFQLTPPFSSILKENKWNWGKVWLPFADGFSTPSSGQKSADKIWKALGWNVARKSDVSNLGVEAGIKVVRLTFGQVYIDETNCDRLIECMKRYCRNINRQTLEAGSPKHDEWCHGCLPAGELVTVPVPSPSRETTTSCVSVETLIVNQRWVSPAALS